MEGFTDDRPVLYEPQNIHAILGHVREIAKSGLSRDLTVRELYEPSLHEVRGRRDGLIQIFLNLLKNAAVAVGLPDSGYENDCTPTSGRASDKARIGQYV